MSVSRDGVGDGQAEQVVSQIQMRDGGKLKTGELSQPRNHKKTISRADVDS
jgi:hypothetical protein